MKTSELKRKWFVELKELVHQGTQETDGDLIIFIDSIFKAVKAWSARPEAVSDEELWEKAEIATKNHLDNRAICKAFFRIGFKQALSQQSEQKRILVSERLPDVMDEIDRKEFERIVKYLNGKYNDLSKSKRKRTTEDSPKALLQMSNTIIRMLANDLLPSTTPPKTKESHHGK